MHSLHEFMLSEKITFNRHIPIAPPGQPPHVYTDAESYTHSKLAKGFGKGFGFAKLRFRQDHSGGMFTLPGKGWKGIETPGGRAWHMDIAANIGNVHPEYFAKVAHEFVKQHKVASLSISKPQNYFDRNVVDAVVKHLQDKGDGYYLPLTTKKGTHEMRPSRHPHETENHVMLFEAVRSARDATKLINKIQRRYDRIYNKISPLLAKKLKGQIPIASSSKARFPMKKGVPDIGSINDYNRSVQLVKPHEVKYIPQDTLRSKTVKDMIGLMSRGEYDLKHEHPPVVVRSPGQEDRLAGGLHRMAAAKTIGAGRPGSIYPKGIPAEVWEPGPKVAKRWQPKQPKKKAPKPGA